MSWQVRVDTKGGQRKTYWFDSQEEANAFAIVCEDKVVSGPTRVMELTCEEAD